VIRAQEATLGQPRTDRAATVADAQSGRVCGVVTRSEFFTALAERFIARE